MLQLSLARNGRRIQAGIAFFVTLFAVGAWGLHGAPALAQGHAMPRSQSALDGHSHASMSSDDMRLWVENFYSTHPVVGRTSPAAAAADTFIATGTIFNSDGNVSTQVDTARITVGQSILWKVASGMHSATNGTGMSDPQAGTLFDMPIDLLNTPEFSFTFNSAGTFPFFCRPHEVFNMKGIVVVTEPAPVDTFTADDLFLRYDADGNPGTVIDTVLINVGDRILWRALGVGFHTVTSGVNRFDTTTGKVFDVPLDPSHQTFVFQFNQVGQFPFFCRPHEEDDMRGVVIVGTPVAVGPPPQASKRIGFATEPAPNPTTGAIAFRVALPEAGHVSARVFDVQGRLVAVPLDQVREAGSFEVRWNGATRSGVRAAPGVYYVKLSLPGFAGTRRFVLTI